MNNITLKVDGKRIEQKLEELGTFGRNKEGGIDRTTFTQAEIEARNWLKKELEALNLEIRMDPAANIWARRKGLKDHLPAIAFGSHIDSVPNGGMYDGALGVVLALEVMRVLNEQEIQTNHSLELVSFSAEEPNPFGLSTFGSRAATGKLKREHILEVTDSSGKRLVDALREAGGDPENFESAVRKAEELSTFLEVHIEQGKRLLNLQVPVGVVTGITGIYREEVTIIGEANHAGTTLMEDRHDALLTTAECLLAFENAVKSCLDKEVVGTVGQIHVKPNATNIIPGEVTFSLELRGQSKESITNVLSAWVKLANDILKNRSAEMKRSIVIDQLPVQMNIDIIECCEKQAAKLGYPSHRLGSMAGHDAAHMASLARACMLFVPSLEGKSHCPQEESRLEDITKVANVLLNSILAIDGMDGK